MLKFHTSNEVDIKKRKSQIIVEFLLLSSIALIATIVFIFASVEQVKDIHNAKEFLLLKDVASKIQKEISMTSYIEDGYSRQFELPEKINDRNYNISIVNNTLIVWTNTTSYISEILNITGYLGKGSNTITKTNGRVYIN